MPIVIGTLGKSAGGVGNQKTIRNRPNYSIVEVG